MRTWVPKGSGEVRAPGSSVRYKGGDWTIENLDETLSELLRMRNQS